MSLVLCTLLAFAPPQQASPAKTPPKFPTVPLKRAEAPKITLPDEIKAEVAAFVTVAPVTTGKNVVFHAIDPGLSVFPPALLSNPKVTVVVAQRAGRFRVMAYTAAGDVPSLPAMTTIVVGDAPPEPPPEPPPGPGPVRPAGFAGECFDRMRAFPKTEVKVIEGVIQTNLADPNLKANIVRNVIAGMNTANLPSERWTPFVSWLRGRLVELYEADGTTATPAEVEQGMRDWKNAAEALLK
jgi:hypothetical protein